MHIEGALADYRKRLMDFPGWEHRQVRPDAGLAYLTEGLEPI